MKYLSLLLISLLPGVAAAKQYLPASTTDHLHQCELVGGGLYDPDERSIVDEYGELMLEMKEDEAIKRFGDMSEMSVHTLTDMGFNPVHDYSIYFWGENEDGDSVSFTPNMELEFVKKVETLREVFNYQCRDREVGHKAVPGEAFKVSSRILVPTEFAVKMFHQFKFDMDCYDDWEEPLFKAEKVRGSSFYKLFEVNDGVYAPLLGIRIDDDQPVQHLLKDHERALEVCHLSNIKERENEELIALVKKNQAEAEAEREKERAEREQELLNQVEGDAEAAYQRAVEKSKLNDRMPEFLIHIQQEVSKRWIRPPGARNGDETVVRIHLNDYAEVVHVEVTHSTASSQFDKSVVRAIEKVGRFKKLAGIDRKFFDANFRTFTMIFKPEMLRL